MKIKTNYSISSYWEKIFSERSWGLYPPEELIRFIARNHYLEKKKFTIKILELGCGPGPNIWYLVREGFAVAGIDISATAIKQAKERLTSENLPYEAPLVDLRLGNINSLPWDSLSFDIIVDIEALYSNRLHDIRLTILEVYRTLKSGGKFFGKMFGVESTGSESGILVEPGTRINPTIGPCAGNAIAHFFTKDELVNLFSEFSTLNIDYVIRSDENQGIKIFEWIVVAQK